MDRDQILIKILHDLLCDHDQNEKKSDRSSGAIAQGAAAKLIALVGDRLKGSTLWVVLCRFRGAGGYN